MAKCIKLEDALKGLNMGYGKYDYVSKVADYYNNLPTIEVSEDAISREYLKSFGYIHKGDFNSVETIREWIDNAPSVAPSCRKNRQVERAEGEWVINVPEESGFGTIYECPYCKYEVEFEPTNYCPNCGARMKG